MRTKNLRVLLPMVGALALTACGTSTTSDHGTMSGASTTTSAVSAPSAGDHNTADIAFATGMIPHHGQALEMADLALESATDPRVKDLATAIKAAQDPEIQLMSSWLTAWGQPVPSVTGHTGHDAGSMPGMGGMMSAEDMAELGAATGAAFDKLWVELMIKHHEGAVEMSQTQLSTGSSAEAKKLAQAIIDGQSTEITAMKAMLPSLG